MSYLLTGKMYLNFLSKISLQCFYFIIKTNDNEHNLVVQTNSIEEDNFSFPYMLCSNSCSALTICCRKWSICYTISQKTGAELPIFFSLTIAEHRRIITNLQVLQMEIHPLTRTATISFSRALFQGISKNKD
jgi:hypothetical protein